MLEGSDNFLMPKSMFLLFVALIFIAVSVVDVLHYRRMKQRGVSHVRCLGYGLCALVTNLLPLVIALTGLVVRDNTQQFMDFAMWAYWVWMATALPRGIFVFFHHFHHVKTGAVLALSFLGILLWSTFYCRTAIVVNEVVKTSDRLPHGFDGYRIVQLSDMHIGTMVNRKAEVEKIVATTNALRPDVVLFTGDLVNIRYTELDAEVMEQLRGFDAPVYCVSGNHDIGTYVKDSVSLPVEVSCRRFAERVDRMGWQLLQDTTVFLHHRGDSISLSGVAFEPSLREKQHDQDIPLVGLDKVYGTTPQSLFNITLTHIPQIWEQIATTPYGDLTLAGHVHSMQAKVRLFGRSFSPAALLYKRWSGRYDKDFHTLYINDGTGYVGFPMRIGAYPEITLFELQSCE